MALRYHAFDLPVCQQDAALLMLPHSQILLIEDCPENRRNIQVILDFLGEEAIITTSDSWAGAVEAQVGGSAAIKCVLLGRCDHSMGLPGLLAQLDKWDDALPAISCDAGDPAGWPDHVRQRLLANLPPPLSYNQLIDALHRAQVYREIYSERTRRGSQREPNLFRSLVGTSRSVQAVRMMMQQVADTEATVLILGESGTGKEVVARNLHYHSRRKDAPFVPVNCGAIPAELLESELFGHEKGAFTGAITSRAGRFELAQGGTLFLDEIGDMPMALQAKMLRFLQERVIERVGGRKEIPVDVRVVCATNQNPENLIKEGLFREDLFYRVSEITINIPPFRDREEGRLVLARTLLQKYAKQQKRAINGFSDDAVSAIESYAWPGNVRELENKIKGAVIMADGKMVTAMDLGLQDGDEHGESLNLREVRQAAESKAIRVALTRSYGNISKAAELLGITRPTLYDLLNKYSLSAEAYSKKAM